MDKVNKISGVCSRFNFDTLNSNKKEVLALYSYNTAENIATVYDTMVYEKYNTYLTINKPNILLDNAINRLRELGAQNGLELNVSILVPIGNNVINKIIDTLDTLIKPDTIKVDLFGLFKLMVETMELKDIFTKLNGKNPVIKYIQSVVDRLKKNIHEIGNEIISVVKELFSGPKLTWLVLSFLGIDMFIIDYSFEAINELKPCTEFLLYELAKKMNEGDQKTIEYVTQEQTA
jgi:hypothetical protein